MSPIQANEKHVRTTNEVYTIFMFQLFCILINKLQLLCEKIHFDTVIDFISLTMATFLSIIFSFTLISLQFEALYGRCFVLHY